MNKGGSIVATGVMVPPSLWKCCAKPEPYKIGECGDGCCTDYKCKNCGRTWRYEWPD